MPSKIQSIHLFRNLLRNAKKIDDYNFKSYAVRKVCLEFHRNKELKGEELEKKFAWGQDQLQMVRRISSISQLYPERKTVLG